MRSWLLLLGGLLVWAAHFFALYGIGEFSDGGVAARGAILLLGVVAILADGLLARRLLPLPREGDFARWRAGVALGGIMLSALAIFWQSLPALIG